MSLAEFLSRQYKPKGKSGINDALRQLSNAKDAKFLTRYRPIGHIRTTYIFEYCTILSEEKGFAYLNNNGLNVTLTHDKIGDAQKWGFEHRGKYLIKQNYKEDKKSWHERVLVYLGQSMSGNT